MGLLLELNITRIFVLMRNPGSNGVHQQGSHLWLFRTGPHAALGRVEKRVGHGVDYLDGLSCWQVQKARS